MLDMLDWTMQQCSTGTAGMEYKVPCWTCWTVQPAQAQLEQCSREDKEYFMPGINASAKEVLQQFT